MFASKHTRVELISGSWPYLRQGPKDPSSTNTLAYYKENSQIKKNIDTGLIFSSRDSQSAKLPVLPMPPSRNPSISFSKGGVIGKVKKSEKLIFFFS
jgi:hypothetical protein